MVKETPADDYEYDEKDKRVLLTEDGTERMERLLEAEGLLVGSNLYDYENTQVVHHLNQALQGQRRVQARHRLYRQGRARSSSSTRSPAG